MRKNVYSQKSTSLKTIHYAIILLFTFFGPSESHAQGHGTSAIPGEKVKFSIIGGPGFNPDMGFLLGGDAVLTFSTDAKDTLLRRSVIPLAMAYFFRGGGLLNVRPQIFFPKDRVRIFGVLSYLNVIDNYYGVGFDTNGDRPRGEFSTEHRLINTRINPIVLFRWADSDFFWGGGVSLLHSQINDPSQGVFEDLAFLEQGGTEEGIDFFNSGLAIRLNYDTRDVPANAFSGLLLEFNATFYESAFGSDNNYGVYSLAYRQYQRLKALGEKKVLAWTVNTRVTSGDVPLTDLSTLGSAFDLRGYYAGQYRDRHTAFAMVEYRHGFEFGRPNKFVGWLSKTGFVVWSGVGTVSEGFNSEAEGGILPNFGAGLRVQLQPRINFRVDVGHDPLNTQTLVYLNVTEAF